MTDGARAPRLPVHVILMLGASTGGYALALAGVAGLQSGAEAAITAAREPALSALNAGMAAHAALEAELDDARRRYVGAATAYDATGAALDGFRADLDGLAATVGEIAGQSRSLPATVQLPRVVTSVPVVRAPATHTTTRASGG